MKSILTGILSLVIFFGAVPTAQASDMNMAGMEEVKKKKKTFRKRKEKEERILLKSIWFKVTNSKKTSLDSLVRFFCADIII